MERLVTIASIVFLKSTRYYTLFSKARSRAKLDTIGNDGTPLRPKDLRSQVVIHGSLNNVSLVAMQANYGHKNASMTQRYLEHNASLDIDSAETITKALFGNLTDPLTDPHL